MPRAKEIAAKEAERREGSNPSDILAALSRVGVAAIASLALWVAGYFAIGIAVVNG